MKVIAIIAALSAAQTPAGPSNFDRPMSELRTERATGPLDRMSLNQMMRMATLSEARLNELKCAGVANWPGSKGWPTFKLTDAQRAEFVDRVAAALAHDVEMEADIAAGLIEAYSEEPPYQEKQRRLDRWRAEVEKSCTDVMAHVRSGTYQLAPLAQPSLINATLAACYVRYTLAAEAAHDEDEAKGLRATAARAEAQALAGKEGEALAKARVALADRLAASRNETMATDGAEMMKLVMCLPAMESAAKEQLK